MATASTIGRFEIEREAASGGVGRIFRGRDPATGNAVAIKVIRDVHGSDVHRLQREAEILARIRHPGVVRYVEHGATPDGDVFLAMEWLEGEDVRERLSRVGLTMSESVTLGRRVAEALAAVHAHGLVHRDIKPANLFLPGGSVDDVKVIDFGLARGDESMGPTLTGNVVGTPAYMAPEQARGQRELDARVDVYSLGCVLYKAISGHAPFEGKDVMAVLAKVLLDDPPRLGDACRGVPPPLDDLVMRMLAKEPSARPPDALAVVEELATLGPLGALGDARPGPLSQPPSGLMVGEQRMVAMLLVGATDAGVDRAAGDAIEALVRAHGGHLDRLLDGTRVVAVVGPAVATDQAARAARCALALREVLPSAPMVLATGRGEMSRRLPVGVAVDRATKMLRRRVSTLPPPASGVQRSADIAIDDVTAALLDPRFDVESGDEGPRLRGLRELDGGARTLLGRETPFVGRAWELSSVEELFRRSMEEPRALPLLVAAPPGMGKTRLRREVVRSLCAMRPDLEVWTARGDALRSSSSLELLSQVVRSACQIEESEPIEARRRKIQKRVELRVPARDAPRTAEMLAELAGAPLADPVSHELRAARQDPHIMGTLMRRAWSDFLAAECAAHPVLITIEDLQWGDPSSVRFLDAALKNLAHLPWMVLALARLEVFDVFPRLWEDRNVQQIRLNPLSRRASESLVREVLGERVSDSMIARLVAQADGNAFYLEELIRAVAASGQLADDDPVLPETVLAMVQTRLEGLDPSARRVLRAASVFGEVFWPGGVLALLGAGTGSVPPEGWIDLLVAREVVARRTERRFAGEEALAFRHALLREGAYAMLTDRDRSAGHLLAGAWLEQQGESDPMVLARHFELGGDPARAGVFMLRAAQQALRGADPDAARALAARAMASGVSGGPKLECMALLCEAHSWRSDWESASAYASEVTLLAEPGTLPWIKGITAVYATSFRLGRRDQFMDALAALLKADPTPDTLYAMLESLFRGFLITYLLGEFELGEPVLRRFVAVVEPLGGDDVIALAWLRVSQAYWAAWRKGDFWSALGLVRAALVGFEAAGDLRHAQYAEITRGMIEWNLGMLGEAEVTLRDPESPERARTVAADGSHRPADAQGAADEHLLALTRTFYRTLVLIDRGSLDEARELAARRIAIAQQRPQGQEVIRTAEGHWLLGEIALREGDLELAEREIAIGGPTLPGPTRQLAMTTLAAVRLRLERVSEARAIVEDLIETMIAKGGVGHRTGRIPLLHAETLHASGDHEAARSVLAAARDDVLANAARITDDDVRRGFLAMAEHVRTLELAKAWGVGS